MRVLKFGGKSLDTKEKFERVCNFVKTVYNTEKQIIVIVSAIGNTTDNLIELSQNFGNNNKSCPELATLLSTGEIQSSSLFAMHLNSIGVPAKCFVGKDIGIRTFGDYTNAIISSVIKNNLLDCLNSNTIAVVAGFQGMNSNGEITTLGRGGSDTTAVALATAFCTEAEIYSDFDGVFAGDPRQNKYKKIDYVGYNTMIEMAKGGAKVLDEKATLLAKKHNTVIISKCSNSPTSTGTIISNIENENITINEIENLSKITITFTNTVKLNIILKNVLICLNSIKFYNLKIYNNYLTFLIDQSNSKKIVSELSKNLDLISI